MKTCIGQFVIFLKCEILIIDTWNEYIKKNDEMVNLFFACYLKFSKNLMNLAPSQKQLELSIYLKWNLDLLRLYSFSHLDSKKIMKILATTGAKDESMATASIWL